MLHATGTMITSYEGHQSVALLLNVPTPALPFVNNRGQLYCAKWTQLSINMQLKYVPIQIQSYQQKLKL